ncbi:MAG TPA: PIG-L family deacetylase [Candidatus Saccharimonadales bacterium]|nr:PIG-L family deacetylase [Candidatus Saccharimonadales bacterium]
MKSFNPFDFSRYLIVIAHPDDEVNCAILLSRLADQGKQAKVVLLTNGDAGMNAAGRADEMAVSLRHIGLGSDALLSLNIPEKELLSSAETANEQVLQAALEYKPDCVLSLDYEGGHEGHDMASFIAHNAALQSGTVHIVFPDYHFRDMHRHGLEFLPGRQPGYTLELSDEDKDLKIKLLEAHRGQLGFYLRLQKAQDDYFVLLFKREVYRMFPHDYDFLVRPDYQIGYEYHRNGFKFDDFAKAIRPIIQGAD